MIIKSNDYNRKATKRGHSTVFNKKKLQLLDDIQEKDNQDNSIQNRSNGVNGIETKYRTKRKIGKITDYIFNKETNLFSGISYGNTKYIEYLYNKISLNSNIQVIFAVTSMLTGFIFYEMYYNSSYLNSSDSRIILSEWFCFLLSIGLWMTFVFEYLLDCELSFYLKKLPEKLWRKDPDKLLGLFKNIFIFLWHPNPVFHNIKFTIYNPKFSFYQPLTINDIMFSLLLMRIWFIFKLMVQFSDYSSARTQRVCQMNNFSVNFSFCMKALMQNIPYHVYGVLLILSLVFCSCNLRIYERGLDSVSGMEFANFWNCIWCIIITMTTVGFGDFFPSSIIGRIIGIISCFIGVFLISMLVVTITNVLNLSNHENNVYMILEKVTLESEKYEISRDLIAKYFNIIRKSKKEKAKSFEADNEKIREMKYDFLKQYCSYQDIRTEIESTYPPYSNYDAINESLTYLEDEFGKVERKQNEINELLGKICNKLDIVNE